jgi:hypothetical protein
MAQYTIFGFTWQGACNSTTTYQPYDVVSRNGSSYNCVATNTNADPATDGGSYWEVQAAAGAPDRPEAHQP